MLGFVPQPNLRLHYILFIKLTLTILTTSEGTVSKPHRIPKLFMSNSYNANEIRFHDDGMPLYSFSEFHQLSDKTYHISYKESDDLPTIRHLCTSDK